MDEVLAALAKKYAVSPGEVCLRWCVEQDVVAVTTSAKEQRLSDYLRAMTFKLTPREVGMVSSFLFLFFSLVWRKGWGWGLFADVWFRSMRRARGSISAASGRISLGRRIGGRRWKEEEGMGG